MQFLNDDHQPKPGNSAISDLLSYLGAGRAGNVVADNATSGNASTVDEQPANAAAGIAKPQPESAAPGMFPS